MITGYCDTGFKKLLASYKDRIEKRGLPFSLSDSSFLLITKKPCYYCGKRPEQKQVGINKNYYLYNGIDRIDSDGGYEEKNVVACCWLCNRMKNIMSLEEFLQKIKEIADYMKSKEVL